jgi:nucleotide-binding universal stress UspA family protein
VRDAQYRWTKFVGDHPARETPLDVTIDNRLQAILRAVREESVDLLVLGTHGETGPDVGTGPLALACAREAPTSVLLVRAPNAGRFERVVACVDFSESSGRALEEAAAIAARDGGHVFALHVFQSPWNQLDYTPPALEPFPEFAERYRLSVEQRLQDFCDKYRTDGKVVPERHVLDHASPGIAIAAFARDRKADLVALGTRGAADARVIPIGSTAERLLQEAPCSVLTVKRKQV